MPTQPIDTLTLAVREATPRCFQLSTVAACIATYPAIGKGDKNLVDRLATTAFTECIRQHTLIPFICSNSEGIEDGAETIKFGELLGPDHEGIPDYSGYFSVDPVEGTTNAARGVGSSFSIAAVVINKDGEPEKKIWSGPEGYAKKIFWSQVLEVAWQKYQKVGVRQHYNGQPLDPENPRLEQPLEAIFGFAHEKLGRPVIVEYLDRERNQYVKDAADRCAQGTVVLRPLPDGDINPSIMMLLNDPEAPDMYVGIGGSTEGVLTAGIVLSLGGGGEQQIAILPDRDGERHRQQYLDANIDIEKIWTLRELFPDGFVVMSAITKTPFGDAIKKIGADKFVVSSLICNTEDQTYGRYIEEYKLIPKKD